MWFAGKYEDLNTALHRFVPWRGGCGWNFFSEHMTMKDDEKYVDDLLKWQKSLENRVNGQKQLPLCAKQFCMLNYNMDVFELCSDAMKHKQIMEKYKHEIRELTDNSDMLVYLLLPYQPVLSSFVIGGEPCDYIHDMVKVINYPEIIRVEGQLSADALDDVRMPFFRRVCQQLIDGEKDRPRQSSCAVLDDIKNRYQGKVVLIDLWSTGCRPCIEEMYQIQSEKNTRYNHPDLKFVYLNIDGKANSRFEQIRKDISGEHILVDQENFDILKHMFRISYFPTMIIKYRDGSFHIVLGDMNEFVQKALAIK